jgi:predicted TIM-barrel fold metal-dependent hydrolase
LVELNEGVTRKQVETLYSSWKQAERKELIEERARHEGVYFLDQIGDWRAQAIDDYFAGAGLPPRTNKAERDAEIVKRDYQESLLVLLDKRRAKGKKWPWGERAVRVREILQKHQQELATKNKNIGGNPFIRDLKKFAMDVINPEYSEEDMKLEYWTDRLQNSRGTASPTAMAGSRP